jgi:hypothetical protein
MNMFFSGLMFLLSLALVINFCAVKEKSLNRIEFDKHCYITSKYHFLHDPDCPCKK